MKSPSLAIQHANNAVAYMGNLAKYNFNASCGLYKNYDQKFIDKIKEYEDIIDKTEDKLNSYLVKITDCELNAVESKAVTSLLHLITDFERIGDYSFNIMERAEVMREKDIMLSESAVKDLDFIAGAVKTATDIEPLEETIDHLEYELKNRHINRLKNGSCAIDRGVYFLDMLSDIERIADHCSNVGVHVLRRNQTKYSINHHEYIDNIHKGESPEYMNALKKFSEKYALSES